MLGTLACFRSHSRSGGIVLKRRTALPLRGEIIGMLRLLPSWRCDDDDGVKAAGNVVGRAEGQLGLGAVDAAQLSDLALRGLPDGGSGCSGCCGCSVEAARFTRMVRGFQAAVGGTVGWL